MKKFLLVSLIAFSSITMAVDKADNTPSPNIENMANIMNKMGENVMNMVNENMCNMMEAIDENMMNYEAMDMTNLKDNPEITKLRIELLEKKADLMKEMAKDNPNFKKVGEINEEMGIIKAKMLTIKMEAQHKAMTE
nr:hypothetical protein [uncultured Cetobacterium sp.]